MEQKRINVVDQEPILPPGYHFNPTDIEIFKYYLLDKVITGKCQFNNISDTDILAHQPWDLPGMDSEKNERYYFWERKRKSEGAGPNRNDRVIKNVKNAYWKVWEKKEVWEKETLWGLKKSFRHKFGNSTTGWLMNEYILDPSHAKDNDHFVLCKIYKKKEKNQEHSGCQESTSKKVAENEPLQQFLKRKTML